MAQAAEAPDIYFISDLSLEKLAGSPGNTSFELFRAAIEVEPVRTADAADGEQPARIPT